MNSTKKQSTIKKMVYRYNQKTNRIDWKLIRTIVADALLAGLAIAWLTTHMNGMAYSMQVVFSTFFIGLVLYFKHKN